MDSILIFAVAGLAVMRGLEWILEQPKHFSKSKALLHRLAFQLRTLAK